MKENQNLVSSDGLGLGGVGGGRFLAAIPSSSSGVYLTVARSETRPPEETLSMPMANAPESRGRPCSRALVRDALRTRCRGLSST